MPRHTVREDLATVRSASHWWSVHPANWRDALLTLILRVCVVLGPVVYLPSLYMAIRSDLPGTAFIDSAAMVTVYVLYFYPPASLRTRAIVFCLMLYILGTWLLVEVGSVSQVYLFGFSLITTILLGLRVGLTTVVLNAATLLTIGGSGFAPEEMIVPRWGPDPIGWIVITLNFVLINTLLALSLGAVISAIEGALSREQDARATLERDRATLLAANRALEDEVRERHRAEALLLESETRLRQITEYIEEAVWIRDVATDTVLYINPAYERILGSPRERVYEDAGSYLEQVHPDDLPRLLEHLPHRAERPIDIEFRIIRPDGQCRWLWVRTTPVFSEETKKHRLVGVATDITERKEASIRLRESEENMRLIVRHDPTAIAVLDKGLRFLIASNQYLSDYRVREADIIGMRFKDVFPNVPPRWLEALCRCVAGAIERKDDDSFERADGTVEYNRWEGRPWYRANGEIGGIIIYSEIITARKNAEMELRESRERFRLAFDNANIGMCLVDTDGRLLRVNHQLCEMLGYNREELEGTPVSEITAPEFRDDAEASIQRGLLGETGFVGLQKCYVHKQGHSVWVSLSSSVVRDDAGMPLYMVSHVQDITKRRQAEAMRDLFQTQLLQAQKMEAVGRLAGGVAHDFNNMLSVILGHAEMARETLDPGEPLHETLGEIVHAGQRSAELTRQLLAFARKQTIMPQVLDLNDSIASTLKMLGRLIGEDIQLMWRPGRDLWLVHLDPAQLNQVLANLIVNARDAINGVGSIVIETGNTEFDERYCGSHADIAPGNYVELSVSDDGAGMTKETLASLFEPFYTTKEMGKGTGLGLATVYGIVKQNGGFINVYSEVSAGSTFRLYLPRREADGAGAESAHVGVARSTGTETILLVEDEAALVALAGRILERLGYVVLTALSPAAAIEIATAHPEPIHLLVTDVVMPDMSGRDVWNRLREIRPGLKCLFMSGYTAEVIAHSGVLDEGVNFLPKPFSVNALAGKVREALDQ